MFSVKRFIPYFKKRQAAGEAHWTAIIREQNSKPTIKCGSMIVVNPSYKGPNPYSGPEVRDPRNIGNRFVVVRGVDSQPAPIRKSDLVVQSA